MMPDAIDVAEAVVAILIPFGLMAMASWVLVMTLDEEENEKKEKVEELTDR
jgi:hypothetical protein